MELVSMVQEAPLSLDAVTAPSQPYPYGLRLNLTSEELAKLGYDKLPDAGTKVRIEAEACVVRSSSEDPDADGDVDYCCIELQITALGLEETEASSGQDRDDDGRAERMYAKGKQAA